MPLPGTSVARLEATDLDVGSSGEISFQIIAGNIGSAFEITSAGNLVTLSPLDREQQETYTLAVVARDSGFSYRMYPYSINTCSILY